MTSSGNFKQLLKNIHAHESQHLTRMQKLDLNKHSNGTLDKRNIMLHSNRYVLGCNLLFSLSNSTFPNKFPFTQVMAANLRIKFESGMIVILLAAPRLVKPLTHKLVGQLLCHGLPHTHDPITQHFADGLVLPKPTHLMPQTRPLLTTEGITLFSTQCQQGTFCTINMEAFSFFFLVITCNYTNIINWSYSVIIMYPDNTAVYFSKTWSSCSTEK